MSGDVATSIIAILLAEEAVCLAICAAPKIPEKIQQATRVFSIILLLAIASIALAVFGAKGQFGWK